MRTLLLLLVVGSGCVHNEAPSVPTGETIATAAAEAARKQQAEDNPTLYASSKDAAPAAPQPAATIRVRALPDGTYTVNDTPADAASLQEALRGVPVGPTVDVQATDNAPYEMVIFAIDAARSAGHENFAMTPEAPKTADAP